MSEKNHSLVKQFFKALGTGVLPEELMADDLTVWTVSSGATIPKAAFLGGIQLLASVFKGDLQYEILSITAENDRVVAEVQSSGTLINDKSYQNQQVFIFNIRDGEIAHVREYMNQTVVQENLLPLFQEMANRKS